MSTSHLNLDARARPHLFHWNGRMNRPTLLEWLQTNHLADHCPDDLLAFWEETGGGDVFESETILGPLGDPEMGDGFIEVNRAMHAQGMPARLFIFHRGLMTSAFDTEIGDYLELDPVDFRVIRRFQSLDSWYCATLRHEFGARYGLPDVGSTLS